MKKIFFALPLVILLAVSCHSAKQATNQIPAQTPVVQTTNPTSSPTTATTINNADFQNGDKVLANINMASKKPDSFAFSGQLSETGSVNPQTYQVTFSNNFSGKLIWPQTEEDVNNNHEIVTGNAPQDYTQTTHYIVVNNKIFTDIVSTGNSPKQGAQGWQAQFLNDPLAAQMGVSQQTYQYPSWLVLYYAQSLTFVKQDGNLYEYTIVPKTLPYTQAYADFNHQGRLEDAGNPSEAGPGDTSAISGTVWIDSNFFVTKEQYFIQHWNDQDRQHYNEPKEGVNITINYSDYNQKFSIQEPIATPQLDEIAQKVKAGESAQQIEQEMGAEQLAQDPTHGRDEKRRGDIIDLKNALEGYYSFYNYYPASLAVLAAAPNGLGLPILTAPEPADGSCTEQQNTYTYSLISPQSYSVTFCLGVGSPEDNLGPGIHTLTEKGIQ